MRSNRFTRLVAGRSDAIAIGLILAAFGIYWVSAALAGHTQSTDSAYFNDPRRKKRIKSVYWRFISRYCWRMGVISSDMG